MKIKMTIKNDKRRSECTSILDTLTMSKKRKFKI